MAAFLFVRCRGASFVARRFFSSAEPHKATAKSSARIALMGAPGSGKGTVAEWIERDFGIRKLSSGDLLRQNIAANTPVGIEAKPIIDSGSLVPDSLVLRVIGEEIKGHSASNSGFNLDGYPRTLSQAEQLEELLNSLSLSLHNVFFINVPDEEIIKRISGRLVHIPSGRVYNIHFKPPVTEGRDDITGEPLIQRPDDNAETVRARLEKFHTLTVPVLKHFEDRGILKVINTTTSKEAYSFIHPALSATHTTIG